MSKNLLFFIIGNAFLFTLVYLTRKTRRPNNVVLFCASLFFTLSIIETAYRNFFKPREEGHFVNSYDPLVLQPHPLSGQQFGSGKIFNSIKLTHSGDTIYNASYTMIVDSSIDAFSYNHRIGYLNPTSRTPKMIFLGCSFTFGQGVNDSETLSYRLGAITNTSTLNLGTIGYGIHHVYKIFLDKYASQNNANRLFIYTMIPDHVLRAGGLYDWSAGPSYKISGDSLVYNGPLHFPGNKFAYYASFFGCYSFIKDMIINIQEKNRARGMSAEYQKAYLMVRKMSQYSKMTGGNFLLLFWDKYRSDANHASLTCDTQLLEYEMDKLRKDGVDIVRVSDILDITNPNYYFPRDGHPTAIAYDAIAKYLAKRLNLSVE
jgi:hypothetical protein